MKLHSWIASLGLVLCLTVCTCRTMTINSFEGQSVTLPCKYDSRYHGLCDICWMRGSIPANGCGNQIIYATGKKVDMQSNMRYQLNGALQMGDASLTILNAKKTDSGLYGCRVHVPGWFNDKKIEVYLVIMEGPVSTTQQTNTVSENVTKHTETEQNFSTLGYVSPTKGPALTTQGHTTPPEHVTTKHTETQPTSSTLGNKTTSTYITKGPVLTTQIDITTIPEHISTKNTETQQTTNTLGNVTTTSYNITDGPVITTYRETTKIPEHVTTKERENDPGASSLEDEKPVNEETRVLAAILVPVILLVLLVLGISSVCLMSKYRGKFRTTIEIAKSSSAYVSYSNLDNSVTLPMTNSPNN
ncbi:hepatitis A virus cellular receptor 1 homolog isoform X2 [Silurus meridionalis]|uniref:Ig-like domain-containing protein n=1 Tax=Silurus meridionalis TaxID=175797 RepID=A0A8T0AGJ3_SILME|nr:hepatitis A virus cellular receptor 1 homolog isoform X2 [Silurus meridionalis]KAF7690418.1 hypothetical protein HF521_012222 [Silurus meridionalis]